MFTSVESTPTSQTMEFQQFFCRRNCPVIYLFAYSWRPHCTALQFLGRNSSGLNPNTRVAVSRKNKKKLWPQHISGNWYASVQQTK